jgi:nucleotide-binding universal stress UspA family protein
VDALVFGKKPADQASGMIPSKVASRSPFSIFMVPSDLPDAYRLQKVMVATDFSEYAGMAMEQALALTDQSKGEVYCHHVYEVPIGYYKTGKSEQEFAAIMKSHAEKSMDKFLKPFKGQKERIVSILSFRNKAEVSRLFWKEAEERQADMVVIGSKGRTGASAIIMGSVADRTINQSLDRPVLVIKKVGENMNFLEALLRV